MAHDAGHARVRDHARGQHGVRRRQQRAEEEASPSSPGRSSACAASATITAVIGIASDELAQRQPPRALEHLRLDLETVAEQDHDQRDRGQHGHEARPGVELEHLQAALAEHEAGEHEERRQRQERAMRDARQQRAAHEDGAEDERATSNAVRGGQRTARRDARGRVRTAAAIGREGRVRVRVKVLGKSPSWQDADGASCGYLVEEAGVRLLLDCGSGVFAKLRARRRLPRRRRGADHPPARGPLPRPRAVLLRADLRAAPAARPGRRWPGPTSALHAPPGALECWRRVVGAWGNDDLIEAAFAVREYDPAETLHVGPLTIRFQPVPHFVAANAVELVGGRGRPVHVRRRPRPVARAVRVRARDRPAAARGDAAGPGAGAAGPHHGRRGRRARRGGGRRAARHHPHQRRAGPRGGPPGRRADVRRTRRTGARRGRVRDLRRNRASSLQPGHRTADKGGADPIPKADLN